LAAAAPETPPPSDEASLVPPPGPDQRRAAAMQFERANQVIATGHFDYAIQLLLSCCKLDPASLVYRQALRQTQKAKYRNNERGGRFAWLFTLMAKARLKSARRSGEHLKVIEHGEEVLNHNPWDRKTLVAMSEAAVGLGLINLAAWLLEQTLRKKQDTGLSRKLARLYERQKNFAQAIALWEGIRKALPGDAEADEKIKELSVRDTIGRGQYQEEIARRFEQGARLPNRNLPTG
jgi:tetratricopeptide (TPR) repeat protein